LTRFTAPGGVQLAYEDTGDGLPVLCLAGLTRNARDFDDFAAACDMQLRLVRMDYRGRGGSDHADPSTYTIPTEAADAVALLDHLGIEKAAILGTSRGGLIAMVLAASQKHRLSAVVLNDIGPELGKAGLDAIQGYVGKPPEARTYDETAASLEKANAAAFAGVPIARWRTCAERWFEETPGGMALRYDPRLADAIKPDPETPLPDLWPVFDALEGLPLGLVRGANSTLLEESTAAEMQRRRPDMAFANVPNRGHVPFLDEPEALAVIKQTLGAI